MPMTNARVRTWVSLACGICAFWGALPLQAVAQPARPEGVADAFVRAWNAHDIDAFGRLFADDADWVTASALKVKGRRAIQDYLRTEHTSWAASTTMTARRVSTRAVNPDTTIVTLEWEIAGVTAASGGPAAPPSPGVTSFVVTRSPSGWTVGSGQVTSGRPR